AVDVHVVVLPDGAEELLEVVDLQLRVEAALDQDLAPAQIHQFLHLLEDRLRGEDVALLVAGDTIEGTELAAHPADVGVVDVPADVEGDDAAGMLALADGVGQGGEEVEVLRLEEAQAVVKGEPLACPDLVGDLLQAALAAEGGGHGGVNWSTGQLVN